MNRDYELAKRLGVRVPRASGDEPTLMHRRSIGIGVFPAPAGMNRFVLTLGLVTNCVPRASGDEPEARILEPFCRTCSPRQRG